MIHEQLIVRTAVAASGLLVLAHGMHGLIELFTGKMYETRQKNIAQQDGII